jgi:predicted phage terminase large subunit-like protein
MTKNAQVKFVWTPKGKTDHKYFELSKLSKTDPEWADYVFSCYDSPYWQKEQLDNIQATIAAYLWLQEYMAQFVDVYENSILNQDHVRYYNDIDINDFDNLYMHCDTTHTWKETSDYFCSVVLWESKKDKNFYVVDFILEKLDVEAQARWTIVLYEKHSQRIKKLTYDEKANQWFGFWIKKLAKEEYKISLPIEELWYPNDKIAHFTPHVPHFKSNRVFLPKNHAKITIATNQLLAFPTKWINDDFVDGVSWVLDNFKIETMDDLDFSIW